MFKDFLIIEEKRSFLFSTPTPPTGVFVHLSPCDKDHCNISGFITGVQQIPLVSYVDCKFSVRADVERLVREYLAQYHVPVVSIVQETYEVLIDPNNGHSTFTMSIKGIPGQGQVQIYAVTSAEDRTYFLNYYIDIKDRRRLLSLSWDMDKMLFGA